MYATRTPSSQVGEDESRRTGEKLAPVSGSWEDNIESCGFEPAQSRRAEIHKGKSCPFEPCPFKRNRADPFKRTQADPSGP